MKRFIVILICLSTLLLMAQSWYPEGSKPLSGDLEKRSLHKINQLLYSAITNGSIVITNQLSVTNQLSAIVGLYNTNNLSVFDTNVLNALTAGFAQYLAIAVDSSNHWNTASNQFNTNLLYQIATSNILAGGIGLANTNDLLVHDTVLQTQGTWITNWFKDQSNFLSSITNQNNAISNILSGSAATLAAGTTVFTNITVADVDVPVVLGVSGWTFRSITFNGFKAARTPNVGSVYIQNASANGSVGIQLLTQGIITIEAAPGTTLNAAQFYIDVVTAADGVVVQTFN